MERVFRFMAIHSINSKPGRFPLSYTVLSIGSLTFRVWDNNEGVLKMELAMIGLGKMGGNMARRLLKGGHRVVGREPVSGCHSPVSSRKLGWCRRILHLRWLNCSQLRAWFG